MAGKRQADDLYRLLWEKVFAGLGNLNTGFDSPLIYHVSPSDFDTVIDRCEQLQVIICGIEVFSGVELLACEINAGENKGLGWARELVNRYRETSNITFCATFTTAEETDTLLEELER